MAWMFCCCLFCRLGAESNLVTSSPFLPPGWGKTAPVEDKTPVVQSGPLSRELEFRGIFEMNGVTKFGVFDKKDQKGRWIPLNGGGDQFTVVRYNNKTQSIMVKSNGRIEELFLKEADDKPLPVVGAISPNIKVPVPGGANNNRRIPPPPPAALTNRNNNNNTTTVPRRRVIRRSVRDSSANSNSGQANQTGQGGNQSARSTPPNLPANIPPPPNFTPGPPPNFTPPPPPNFNQ